MSGGENNNQLSKRTSIFGLKFYVVLGIAVGSTVVLFLFFLLLWLTSRRKSNAGKLQSNKSTPLAEPAFPNVSKEIQEIKIDGTQKPVSDAKPLVQILSIPLSESDDQSVSGESAHGETSVYIVKEHQNALPELRKTSSSHGSANTDLVAGTLAPEVSHLGWGLWYTLRELEIATNGFAVENVIGEGGYGIVYRGVLLDNTHVAIKNLLNNRGQAETEFKGEVEAIGRVRHKNLVRLLGYCAEGAHRLLVYEYVENGNLEQWLHGEVGEHSPLTWEIRMNIILGTAKGLTYLHEGLEPKVVHRDVKSSNILLDKQWNSKLSDFGLAKLLCSERSYVTTRVMGTFGYVAPEYAGTGMLTDKSDVYSFGILMLEIISGRTPVDYSRPPGEVNLVERLKAMVAKKNTEGYVDPKLLEKPSSRALKRVLLIALRCIDPDAQKRPKISNVIHMLEADDFPFRDDRQLVREPRRILHGSPQNADLESVEKPATDSEGGNGCETVNPLENRFRDKQHAALAK